MPIRAPSPPRPADPGDGATPPTGTRVHWRLAFALVVLAAFAAVLLFTRDTDPEPGSLPRLRTGELSAEAMVGSIGTVVHFNYVDTAYGRQADVLGRLRELGVRHIRDAMPSPVEPLGAGLRAARLAGIRATLATGDLEHDPQLAVADSLEVMGTSIEAFEGPNELDNSGDPAWAAKLREYMPALAAAVRQQAPGVPLIGPSLVHPGSRGELPRDLPGLLNGHLYPGGGPPEPVIAELVRELEREPGNRGIVFTETGYHNALRDTAEQPPASELATAVYLPRLLVTAFGAGVRRTFVYELLDEKPDPRLGDLQQHFGLLRNDLSPKPAFAAIQTLIAALRASPGEGPRDRLRWTLEVRGDEEVERLSLARRDGSRVIALWRPVSVWDQDALRPLTPPPVPVEVAFGRRARDISVWRPSYSPAPVLRLDAADRLPLDLHGDLVLVSLR